LRCLNPSNKGPSSGQSHGWTSVGEGAEPEPQPSAAPADAWERLTLARNAARPRAPFVLDKLLGTWFELRGDRTGASDDGTVVVRAGTLHGSARSVVAIGQDASGDARIKPQGYRKAIRALEVAGRLGLPVVTLIDT